MLTGTANAGKMRALVFRFLFVLSTAVAKFSSDIPLQFVITLGLRAILFCFLLLIYSYSLVVVSFIPSRTLIIRSLPMLGSIPSVFGAKPSVFTPKPSVFGTKPSVFTPKPSVFDAKPSVFGAIPSVFGAKPSVFGAIPSVFAPKPSVFGAKPSVFAPKPFGVTKTP